jgi:hypothetical protein
MSLQGDLNRVVEDNDSYMIISGRCSDCGYDAISVSPMSMRLTGAECSKCKGQNFMPIYLNAVVGHPYPKDAEHPLEEVHTIKSIFGGHNLSLHSVG